MKLKTKITELVNNFKQENAWDRSEEHIQTMFTVKLLDLLGFNSSNMRINQGQEVKTGKKPDILLFNNSGNTILVIESKDASKTEMLDGRYQNKTFVEQLIGYCNAEGIYWGILTNFVEWRIYSIYQDRLYKDRKYAFHDILWQNSNKNNYIDLLSEEGLMFFDRLSNNNLVSLKGRFDDDPVYYPQQDEIKDKFFHDLKSWRNNLRNYIVKNYSNKYGIDEIDLMTQKILDRLIFIDYCSDNNIITQDRLHAILHSKGNLQNELNKIFKDMDEKFNSELFAPNESDQIKLDDEIIQPIIIQLSNTDFSKLSVHVIGEVYENYLAELLKTGKRGVKVEESKITQKKKSQGIYYTPDFIVNYIVENTLGAILKKCKTEKDIENIRILDPACGSGSFLIRAFDEFLKHYERVNPSGLFHFDVRKKILQNNIYGVDLDERAVEVAKLNLLVKALEGSASVNLSGKKLLPNLKLNIRCGNSLIFEDDNSDESNLLLKEYEKDIIELKKLHSKFNTELRENDQLEIYKNIQVIEYLINSKLNTNVNNYFKHIESIKPFNYSIAFPEVFNNGGFDCVIGNPPYINAKMLVDQYKDVRDYIDDLSYYETKYQKWDIYIPFIERGLKLLKHKGLFSMIIPYPFINQMYAKIMRKMIIEKYRLIEIADLSGEKIFKDAMVTNCIPIICKDKPSSEISISRLNGKIFSKIISKKREQFVSDKNTYVWNIKGDELIIDVNNNIKSKTIGDYFFISKGMVLNADENKAKGAFKKEDLLSDTKSKIHIKQYIDAKDIDKYVINNSKWLEWNTNRVPNLISRPTFIELYETPKILINKIGHLKATYDDNNLYCDQTIRILILWKNLKGVENKSINNSIKRWYNYSRKNLEENSKNVNYKFILAILNSKLGNHLLNNIRGEGNIDINPEYLKNIPIPDIQLFNDEQHSIHDQIVALSDKMLLYHSNPANLNKNQIKILSTEREINSLVYKLYGLSKDDIKIIDQS